MRPEILARSTLTRAGRFAKTALWGCALGALTACSGAEPAAPAEALGTVTDALHQDETLTLAFDLYWFDEGFQGDGDNRDFWVNGRINGSPFNDDLEPGCCDGHSAIPVGRATTRSYTRTIPAGTLSVPISIKMVERDSGFIDPEDDPQDISPNGNTIEIDVDMRTGRFSGELEGNCSNPALGCRACSPGVPGDGSDGVCFSVTATGHCIGDNLPVRDEGPDGSLCNGVDDDCDGEVDEDFDADSRIACGPNNGCAGSLSQSCVDGQVVIGSCELGQPAASDTSCNNFDDDCDGDVDEDYFKVLGSCGGTGACAGDLVERCDHGVKSGSCDGVSGPAPDDSICNGSDDDCDGEVDEDFVTSGVSCGPPGSCGGRVTLTCENGTVSGSACEGAHFPSAEVLDAIDNDCDGQTDECAPGATDFWCCPIGGGTVPLTVSQTADEVDPLTTSPEETTYCRPDSPTGTPCTLRGAFRLAELLRDTTCVVEATLPPGTYGITRVEQFGVDEGFRMAGGDLTLVGTTADPRSTIIDGESASTLINVSYALGGRKPTTLALRNVTLTRGRTLANGGALVSRDSDVVLDNVYVTDNNSNQPGAGLAMGDSRLFVMDSVFAGNYVDNANDAGGVTSHAGAAFIAGTSVALIERSAFIGNLASKSAGLFVAEDARLELTSSTVSGNLAAAWGGGLTIHGEAVLKFNTITNNELAFTDADFRAGAGMLVWEGARLTAIGNIIAGNVYLPFLNEPTHGVSADCSFRGTDRVSVPTTGIVLEAAANLIGEGGDDCALLGAPGLPYIGTPSAQVDPRLLPLDPLAVPLAASQVHRFFGFPFAAQGSGLAECPAYDQRGYLRPLVSCSLGAYEFNGTPDPDGDGIAELIDTAPLSFSNEFSDRTSFGSTTGTIVHRGDQVVIVQDRPGLEQGVELSAAADGGTLPAQISACGGTVHVTLFPGQTHTLTCQAPQSCVFSNEELVMLDRSDALADVFAGSFTTGFDTIMAGNLLVAGSGTLGTRGSVGGSATLGGTLSGNRAGVIGTLLENAAVTPQSLLQRSVTAGASDVTVASGTTHTLAPGRYRDVLVRSNATLLLDGAGVYELRSLTSEGDARVNVQSGGHLAVVAATGNLVFGDRFRMGTGTSAPLDPARVLFYANGPSVDVRFDAIVQGSVEAPLALLELRDRAAVNGCTRARRLTLGMDSTAGHN